MILSFKTKKNQVWFEPCSREREAKFWFKLVVMGRNPHYNVNTVLQGRRRHTISGRVVDNDGCVGGAAPAS